MRRTSHGICEPGALRVEVEPQRVGPQIEGQRGILVARDPADLDLQDTSPPRGHKSRGAGCAERRPEKGRA